MQPVSPVPTSYLLLPGLVLTWLLADRKAVGQEHRHSLSFYVHIPVMDTSSLMLSILWTFRRWRLKATWHILIGQ